MKNRDDYDGLFCFPKVDRVRKGRKQGPSNISSNCGKLLR